VDYDACMTAGRRTTDTRLPGVLDDARYLPGRALTAAAIDMFMVADDVAAGGLTQGGYPLAWPT